MVSILFQVFVAFLCTNIEANADDTQDKVIYGQDNRHDFFEENDPALRSLSESTAIIISKTSLKRDLGGYQLNWKDTLSSSEGVCSDEPFSSQKNPGLCSAFLVYDDIVVTAGHCLSESNLDKVFIVFGFRLNSPDNTATFFSFEDVYSAVSIIQKSEGTSDWAVIRLDRPVNGRFPLKYRSSGKVSDSQSLVVLGYPLGLPLKIAGGAIVRDNSNPQFFETNLDTYRGNSGSAVINAQTLQVEGVLVRGDEDFELDPNKNCYRSQRCSEFGCRGEDCTRSTEWSDLIPTISSSIVAWGNNNNSQCNVPSPNSDFIAVSAGNQHSLGLRRDGSVVAWGLNDSGQCNVPSPNFDFIAVSAGNQHSLGLSRDGSVVAWGLNDYGQCNVPSPNFDFIAISAGYQYSLGLRRDGSVVAWGLNDYGQCNVPSPNSDFIAVSSGGAHSLGLRRDGSVVAWGYNGLGQCNVPSPNSDFIAVSSGGAHSLGLRRDGSVVAWGYNYYGQTNLLFNNSGIFSFDAGNEYNLALQDKLVEKTIRQLPPYYTPGIPFSVTISVQPDSETINWALEESPAFMSVNQINSSGTWDNNNGKIKWGPYFDSKRKTFSYQVTPDRSSQWDGWFSGIFSVDGTNQTIEGDQRIPPHFPHPADLDRDWKISINQMTAYFSAWKRGEWWNDPPNPIPIDYVTKAGVLWKKAESYHYDPNKQPPSCWTVGLEPGLVKEFGSTLYVSNGDLVGSTPTVIRSISPEYYSNDNPVFVTLVVQPNPSNVVWAVEEIPPQGWYVDEINEDGVWDTLNEKVKWGPFFESTSKVLSYTLFPSEGDTGLKIFTGSGSFDGQGYETEGKSSISNVLTPTGTPPTPTETPLPSSTPTPTMLYDIAPEGNLDGFINQKDLIVHIKKVMEENQNHLLLFGISLYWQK